MRLDTGENLRLVIFTLLLLKPALAAESETARVDRIFAAFDKPDSPGCALGIVRDGDFIYRKGYGMGSLELNVPLNAQSVFYMGSVSKQFTAASVVLAAEQGLLSLDDDIRKHIPEVPDYGRPITLRQMLHHTSGFRDVLALLALSGRSAADAHPTAEFLDLVARQKALNYPPGEEYLYSNTNYFLAAEAVARAAKMPFSEFARRNIFQPLGMTHTRFHDDHRNVVPGRVAAYSPRKEGGFIVDWSANFDKVGDGGLMSSVDDLLQWDRNFYRNKLGKGTLLQELQTRGVLNNGQRISYALGLTMAEYRGLPIVEHGGSLFGYRTELLRFPEQRFSVICLCNLSTANPGNLARHVADVYLDKRMTPPVSAAKPVPAARTPEASHVDLTQLAGFAGVYRSAELDAVYRVSLENEGLVLRVGWNPPVKLEARGPDIFEGLGMRLTFRGGGLSLSAGRVHNIGFEKLP